MSVRTILLILFPSGFGLIKETSEQLNSETLSEAFCCRNFAVI
jgi:hypothetical protein